MAFKKVKVTLHNIKNENTGDDSGDQLEIFGRFDVARLIFNHDIGELQSLNKQNLFDVAGENAVDLDQGAAIIVDRSATLDIFDGEFLQIIGHLFEEDDGFGGDDDPLGGRDKRLKFSEINSGLVDLGNFRESDQIVSVKMSIFVEAQG